MSKINNEIIPGGDIKDPPQEIWIDDVYWYHWPSAGKEKYVHTGNVLSKAEIVREFKKAIEKRAQELMASIGYDYPTAWNVAFEVVSNEWELEDVE